MRDCEGVGKKGKRKENGREEGQLKGEMEEKSEGGEKRRTIEGRDGGTEGRRGGRKGREK